MPARGWARAYLDAPQGEHLFGEQLQAVHRGVDGDEALGEGEARGAAARPAAVNSSRRARPAAHPRARIAVKAPCRHHQGTVPNTTWCYVKRVWAGREGSPQRHCRHRRAARRCQARQSRRGARRLDAAAQSISNLRSGREEAGPARHQPLSAQRSARIERIHDSRSDTLTASLIASGTGQKTAMYRYFVCDRCDTASFFSPSPACRKSNYCMHVMHSMDT